MTTSRYVIDDRSIDVYLDCAWRSIAEKVLSSGIVLRFNFKRVNVEELRQRIARVLNVDPSNVKLYSSFVVFADFVWICEDEACTKTKPRPLTVLDSFVLLKEFLRQ